MTREEAICNAARERADRHEIAEKELHNYNSQLYFYDRIYNAEIASFEAGVEWAYNHPVNVWHDASKEPDHNRTIVITTVTNQVGIIPLGDNYVWFWNLSKDSVRMWAYIDDLLPKGGKK